MNLLFGLSGVFKIFDSQWIEEFLSRISPWGYVVLLVVIFCETAVLIGMFLPGDSLLFVAGFLAFKGNLNIWILLPLIVIAAIAGDQFAYTIGERLGARLFKNEDARFLKKSHIEKTQAFFDKYGAKTIVISRFVPIVRAIAPTMAGAAKMKRSVYLKYNIVGAFIWGVGVTLLGYFLGKSIGAEKIDKYLLPIFAFVVLLSLSPAIFEGIKHKLDKRKVKA
ncbi:MAG: VTT domain-containing protein [Acidimicrobiia bacterium]